MAYMVRDQTRLWRESPIDGLQRPESQRFEPGAELFERPDRDHDRLVRPKMSQRRLGHGGLVNLLDQRHERVVVVRRELLARAARNNGGGVSEGASGGAVGAVSN